MPDPIPEKNIENISLSDVYAKRAEEEYKRLSSQPTARDKISGSAKSASDKLSGGDSNLGRNLLIGAAVAGGAYLAYNLLFDSEERAETKADESKSSLLGKTLGVLGLGIGGYFLYDFLEGKVDWTEVMEAWDKDGFTGVGSMILDKAKDGVLGWFSSDTLIQIGELLGFPSLVAYAKLMKTKDNLTAAGQGAIDKAKDLIPGLGNPDDTENPGGPLASKPGDTPAQQSAPSPGAGTETADKDPERPPGVDPKYIYIKRALEIHTKNIENTMAPITAGFERTKEGVLSALGSTFGVSPSIKVLATGVGFGSEKILAAAQGSLGAIGDYPLASLFGGIAVLQGIHEIKDLDPKLLWVPPEPPEAQVEHYIKLLKDSKVQKWMAENGIKIPEDKIEQTAQYMSDPKLLTATLKKVDDWADRIYKNILNAVNIDSKELIVSKNLDGIKAFEAQIQQSGLEDQQKKAIQQEISTLLQSMKLENQLTRKNLDDFMASMKVYNNISFELGEKKIRYTINDGTIEYQGNLCVNPDLPVEEQEEIAEIFLVNDDLEWGHLDDILIQGQWWTQNRRYLAEYMQAFENGLDAKDDILSKLASGTCWVMVKHGEVYLEGAYEALLGPVNLVGRLLWAGASSEYSVVEALYETANGIVPVMIFGTTTALLRRESFKKAFFLSPIYPFTMAYKYGKLIHHSNLLGALWNRNMALLDSTPKSYVSNRLYGYLNDLGRTWNRGVSFIPGHAFVSPHANQMYKLRMDVSRLREALTLAHEIKFNKRNFDGNKTKILDVLRDMSNDIPKFDSTGNLDGENGVINWLESKIEGKKFEIRNVAKLESITEARAELGKIGKDGKNKDFFRDRAIKALERAGEWELIAKHGTSQDIAAFTEDLENREKKFSQSITATPDPARTQALTDFDTKTESEKIKTIEDLDTKIAEHHAKMQTEMEGIRNRSGFNTGQRIDIDAEKAKIRATYIPQIEADFRLRAEMSGKLAASGFDFKFHHLELDARLARKFGVPIPKGVAIDENAMKNFIQNHKGKLAKGGLAAAAISGIAYIMLAEDDKEHINISDYSPKPPATPSGTAAEADQKKKIAEAPTVNKLDNPEYVDAEADQLFQELNALGKNYTDYFAIFAEGNEEKIKNFSEDELQRIVKNTVNKHEDALPQIMKILTFERELLNRYMQNHPNHEVNINPALTLSYDPEKKQAYFNYPTAEEFENFAYAYFDATQAALKFPEWVQENKGVKLSADIVQEMLPLWSTYLSAKRANLAARRGQSLDIIGKETGVAMFSAVSDLLTGGALKAGVKGAIAAKGFKGKTLTFFKDFWHGGAAGGAATMTRTEKLANRSGQIMMLDMGVQLSPIAWATISGAGLTQFKTNYYLNPDASKLGDIPANAPRIGFTIDNDPPYDADPDTMKKHAEESINFLINKCYWKNLKYEIIDPHTITIGRTTSNEQITIKRHPDNNPYVQKSNKETGVWELEGLDKAYSNLSQAIAMANLVNDTAEFIKNSGYTAGSDQPFHREQTDRGEVIEFDAGADLPDSLSWDSLRKSAHGAYDLEILNRNKDNNWLDFYNKRLGIETHWIENILNNWYNLKHKK